MAKVKQEVKVISRMSQIGRAMGRLDRAAADLRNLGVTVECSMRMSIDESQKTEQVAE